MMLKSREAFIEAMRAAGSDDRSLSCAELGRRAKCSKAMIGHLRTGKITRCTPELAARIERGLGMNTGSLFEPVQTRVAS